MHKLLILDDSDDILSILKIFFEKRGYNVKTLQSADDIFSEVNDFKP